MLQCISASYERILMKFFGGKVGRGPVNNRLNFVGDADHDTNPPFLDPHPGI